MVGSSVLFLGRSGNAASVLVVVIYKVGCAGYYLDAFPSVYIHRLSYCAVVRSAEKSASLYLPKFIHQPCIQI